MTGHDFLSRYSELDSLVHRLDPRTKLVITLAFILAVATAPADQWQPFAAYLLLVGCLALLSRIPPVFILKRSLLVLPFALAVASLLPFFKPGEPLAAFATGPWNVTVTREGLLALSAALARSWLSMAALVVLTASTRLDALLKGLEQMRMPRLMVLLISLVYRYTFVLADETLRMKRARDSRNFAGARSWRLRTIGDMVGTLFLRSFGRAERIYRAMSARGFQGQTTPHHRLQARAIDWGFGTTWVLLLAGIAGAQLIRGGR